MNGPKWTSKEIDLLKISYKLTNKELREILPTRNLSAVLNKMHRMGLDRPISVLDRFYKFIKKDPETGCWLWKGALQGTKPWQYGSLQANGKIDKAHHVSWELHNGPIPDGILVCHKCDNTICANPEHLFLGTHTDNMRDMTSKGRNFFAKGSKNGNAILDEGDVLKIRSDNRPVKEIAKEFGVTPACIYDARTRWWKHVPRSH